MADPLPAHLANLDVPSALARAAKEFPGDDALVGSEGRYTFAELERATRQAAGALAALGVGPGDRVAASLPNDTSIVISMLGTFSLGAIWVGVHRVLAPPEKQYMLAHSGASVLLAEPSICEQVAELRDSLPDLKRVVACEPGHPNEDWTQLLSAAEPWDLQAGIDPHAPAAISYTSGTTGRPKGVVHSQHNVLAPGAVFIARGSVEKNEPNGVMLPMTILNLMVLGPLTSIQAGSKLVCIDRHDPVSVAGWIREERVALFSTVPTAIHDLLTHPDVHPEDLATLSKPRVGGANSPEWFREMFRERFGSDLSSSYALTEGPTLITREEPGDERAAGSLGCALPHIELSIRDPEDRELETGEVGEICVGPRLEGPWAGFYSTMLGYWNDPEASAEALHNGRLHTGDLGRVDETGRLYLVERRNQLIIRGGSNIYPSEIEHVLARDERIADCVVVARSDVRLGEIPVAFIEPARGATVDPEELRKACLESLARYKVPESFHIVESLPRGALGKVQRHVLQERAGEA
ncbi:AMP-binding protein [Myxococcota bacterium]|nr:AMP-binding protein [Myxococcota bacterium]